jgi:hypothetical protein
MLSIIICLVGGFVAGLLEGASEFSLCGLFILKPMTVNRYQPLSIIHFLQQALPVEFLVFLGAKFRP